VTLVTLDYSNLNFSSGWTPRTPWEEMHPSRINQRCGGHNTGKMHTGIGGGQPLGFGVRAAPFVR